jgi:uncharacterized protein (DUF1800 family)
MATTTKARIDAGIEPYLGSWDSAAVLHLLKRVHFGPTKENLDYFKSKSLTQAVDEILTIDYSVPSPPINTYNDNTTDPNIAAGQTWVNDYNGSLNGLRMNSFKQWWTGEIINHDKSIREKMVLFWHNHFSTQADVYNWPNFGYQNNSLLRSNCLKNFKTLVKDVTIDPAMLIFLNGERNTKTAPDENFSRELQELFTLGKGPDSGYTEDDVIAGAKVFTGWRINKTNGDVYFQENRHDTTDKVFSSFYGGTTVTGKTGAQGADEIDDMLTMIFNQNEVAKHIVRKLYRWFVYYDIDAATETDVIVPLANIFRSGNYEIKPVLNALFKSAHFFDVANRGALLKSPADFTFGLCRTFDVQIPGPSEYLDQYRGWYYMFAGARLQQQELGDPPSVAGWQAYYQIPQYHELWINSDTLPNRNKISDVMISSGYNLGSYRLRIDPLLFTKKFDNPQDPDLLIDDLLELLHTIPVEQSQKDYMKTILLSGQLNDSYWTDAWNEYMADQSNTGKQNVVSLRLIYLIKYLMNLGEFQLS